MAEYKFNHFVPQWMLNNFKDENGQFFCYDKLRPSKGVEHRNTKSVFARNDIYIETSHDGTRDTSLESEHFKELDKTAKPVVEIILAAARKNHRPQLSPSDRITWNRFFYNQGKRTPDSHAQLRQVQEPTKHIEQVIRKLEQKEGPLTKSQWDYISNKEVEGRILHGALIRAMKIETPESLELLQTRGLRVGKVRKQNRSFVIGSNPLIRLTSTFEPEAIDWWFPIAHDVVVCFGGPPSSEEVYELADTAVRSINEASFGQSSVVGSRSELLLKSLVNAT